MVRFLFELTPVLMAVLSSVMCAYRYTNDRRAQNRIVMVIGVISSVLLIVAQTSWWSSFTLQGSGIGTEFADVIWTIFNNLVMLAFIVAASRSAK